MSKTILIHQNTTHCWAILLQNNTPVEIRVERHDSPSWVGNIYLGIVVRVLTESCMAFVDIGAPRTALLHFSDCVQPPRAGEKCLVQVIKEPLGDKGARVSMHITLVHADLIYKPTAQSALHISKKIQDPIIRQSLSDTLHPVAGTMIVRTHAQYNPNISQAAKQLHALWQQIIQQKQAHYRQKSPKLLHAQLSLPLRFVRDYADKDTVIWTDCDAVLDVLTRFFAQYTMQKNGNLFQDFAISSLIQNAQNRHITLPSGGHIVIDEVEAMTVIDVNAGTSNSPTTTNREAVLAIAHAIRLKNISGIIVIDFIDMPKSAHPQIIKSLKSALQNDPMSTQVYTFSRLGLLEMTRERVYLSLAQAMR